MKLPTGLKRFSCGIAVFAGVLSMSAQGLTQSNPLEYAAIHAGEKELSKHIAHQSQAMSALAVEQGVMTLANTKMKQWEQKYNSYLKTASGYASAIKAATTLYANGLELLAALWEVHVACNINPQGIAASVSMTNIYMETATEFIRTYRAIKHVLAKGGEGNMLNGAERTQMLWNLVNNLEQLNRKLRRLSMSIMMYSFEDVWNRAIAGKISKTNKMLAIESSKRMRRAISNVAKYYKYRQEHKPWGQ